MAVITLNQLPEQVKVNYGILVASKPVTLTPFLDLFKKTAPLMSTRARKIEWRYRVDKAKAADLIKRGERIEKTLNGTHFRKVEIEPGIIFASESLTADEITQMQADSNNVFFINGQAIPTAQVIAEEKYGYIKDAIDSALEIMCEKLINNGIVPFADGTSQWDFGLPAPVAKTYNATTGFLKLVKDIDFDYTKKNRKKMTNFLIGETIVDKMLQDTSLQATMLSLGMNNIAAMSANDKAMVIGTFMGKNLEQMPYTFDQNGVTIIPGNVIKCIDTAQLKIGYGAIDVKNPTTKYPDTYLGDYYTGIQEGTDLNPDALLFVKTGAFAIVVDPVSIQTYEITMA